MKHSKVGDGDIVYTCDEGKVTWVVFQDTAYYIHAAKTVVNRSFYKGFIKQLKKMKAKHGVGKLEFYIGDANVANDEVIISAVESNRHTLPINPTIEDLQQVA